MEEKNKKTILVVEDEDNMRRALVDKLNLEEFLVIEAVDGEVGLSVALNQHPDLILLDLAMPRMSGMEMMNKIRQDDWGRKVPIIILTNFDADDSILSGVVANEPSYYLVKSNSKIEDVVGKIKEILS